MEKDIGNYVVRSDGTVFSKFLGHDLKKSVNHKGYIHYSINRRTRLAQRLVWNTFVGEVPVGSEVDHINNDRKDNRLCNLQVLTKSQNNQKSWDLGNKNNTGALNGRCIISEELVHIICKRLETCTNMVALAKELGIPKAYVNRIKARVNWLSISCLYNIPEPKRRSETIPSGSTAKR